MTAVQGAGFDGIECPSAAYGLRSSCPTKCSTNRVACSFLTSSRSVIVPRQVLYRRVASSGEKCVNTFTRLKSQVRVLQRPLGGQDSNSWQCCRVQRSSGDLLRSPKPSQPYLEKCHHLRLHSAHPGFSLSH